MEIKGIDVSRYNGAIDWASVKKAGIGFAMLRCGTGYKNNGSKDTKFETYYKQAKSVGMPVGAYFYSYAKSVTDVKREAANVITWLAGKQFEYPIVFDIEDKSQANLGKKVISNMIRAFCEAMENAGYYAMVYANVDWLRNRIDDDCKKDYDIWVAQWSSKCTYGGPYGMWQYTDKGKCDGIKSAGLDMNIAYKDYPALIKAKGLNGFKKVVKEENTTKPTTTPKPEVKPTPKPVETKPEVKPTPKPVKVINKGKKVVFHNTHYYSTATSKDKVKNIFGKVKLLNGIYYIYDGIEINGRYRVTNSAKRVGKTPIGLNVTGYVDKDLIR